MSAELIGTLGGFSLLISGFLTLISVVNYFLLSKRYKATGDVNDAEVFSSWGVSVFATVLLLVGFVSVAWLATASEQRGYSDHEFPVVIENGNQATLNVVTPEFSSLDHGIAQLKKEGLNRRFNRQFEDGEVIKLRIYESYVAGLVFDTRIELLEEK